MNNDVLTKWISMQCSPKPKFNRPEQKKTQNSLFM